MTAKELSRIPKLRIEIDILTDEINAEKIGDTVTGSDNEDPFTKRTVRISGLTKKGLSKKKELKEKQAELYYHKKMQTISLRLTVLRI